MNLSPFTEHGGRVGTARAVFGGEDWIDLSTGIAPWAYPAPSATLERLPEPSDLAALEASAAIAFGVPQGREVVAVPGTDMALRFLSLLVATKAPARLDPGYAGHGSAWPGAEPWAGGGNHDLLVIANPNNPDGRRFDRAQLLGLAGQLTLIVDEAYVDADPALSVADAPVDKLVVLRSFGKFYGLAGLRLGFVIASPTLAPRLRQLLGDWPINAPALAAGLAAYRDAEWAAGQRARLAGMGALLDGLLDEAGVEVVGGTPYFRLIEAADAQGLFRRLAARAILVRPFSDAVRRLRIGLPADATQLARLAAALRDPK